MVKSTKRLSILTPDEVYSIFKLPVFSDEEREVYFTLSDKERSHYQTLRGSSSKLYFLLQLGYFKAKNQFFAFSWQEITKDRKYLIRRYALLKSEVSKELPVKNTKMALQKTILDILKYRNFDQDESHWVAEKSLQLCRVHIQPRFVLTELLRLFENKKIVLPGYSTLQKIISNSVTKEKLRLNQIVKKSFPTDINKKLNDLLVSNDSFYELTVLKKRAKDFKLNQIKQEIVNHNEIKDLYLYSCDFLPSLEISHENIKHYASLAEYYPIHRLQNMPRMQAHLYLLCFSFHCYEKISDNLISSFIYQVSNSSQLAKSFAKDKIAEVSTEHKEQLNRTGELIHLFVDKTIDEKSQFKDVKEKAFSILDEEKIKNVVNFLSGGRLTSSYYEWQYILSISRKSTLNLRPLFLAIEFKSTLESDPLIEIVSEVKRIFKSGKTSLWKDVKEAMKDIVPARLKSSIKETAQYEFYIYSLLKNGLEAGDIYYSSSTKFKSFEEDLITDEELKNSQEILKSLDLPLLEIPMAKRLKLLKEKLEEKYREVNEKINRGDHELKFSTKNEAISWHLPYKKQEDNVNNFFYEKLPQISIISVLQFVNQHCEFLDSFKHIQSQNPAPDFSSLIACLVSYGERFGHSKMANISDMKIHKLRSIGSNYMQLENIRAANDVITNATAKLPIFKHFNFNVGSLHASADGQKFEAKRPVFEARYSPKYFGLHKGLVNYSLGVVEAKLL